MNDFLDQFKPFAASLDAYSTYAKEVVKELNALAKLKYESRKTGLVNSVRKDNSEFYEDREGMGEF